MDVGTDRVQEEIEERRKEAIGAERSEGGRPRWLDYLAISTALFAVLAALAALEAGSTANEALYLANQAVLQQTRAVDSWSEYQADSVKKYAAQNLATVLSHVNGTPAEIAAAQAEAAKRQARQGVLQTEAQQRDAETAALSKDSQERLEHHHRFALSVTIFQVAIGLAAIAALLRQPRLWLVSLGAGAAGVLSLVNGFTLTV